MLFVYKENCTLAGRRVPQNIIDNCEDPLDGWSDWFAVEVTEKEAEFWEKRGMFGHKVAKAIRESLRWN